VDVPVIDLAGDRDAAAAIDRACRAHGFFVLTGHGVDPSIVARPVELAREFFALGEEEKAEVAMSRGGPAWRGWFPLGGELTSGVPDRKEGLYFGAEEPATGRPLQGPNLFPARPAGMRDAVLGYLEALTALGHRVVAAIEAGLGASPGSLTGLTADPLILFRIFEYPPGGGPEAWGVGEHTDYGLLTILQQDDTGGLQVRVGGEWVDVPPVAGSFVCNIGDMLERATGGRYRSTPHRVRNASAARRVSMPFFFDPGWDARVEVLDLPDARGDAAPPQRWDDADPLLFDGTYGEYVLSKVSKVFPALRDEVIDPGDLRSRSWSR
jgi:isopenicillin N synthase-like dioxygenase